MIASRPRLDRGLHPARDGRPLERGSQVPQLARGGDRRHGGQWGVGPGARQGPGHDPRAQAAFEVPRILEIEAEVRHDVIAFLTNVNEHVGDAGRYMQLA